jgi:xylulose-5-phosphate/fructose-6-phosphate phosphoketolase
VPYFVEGDDPSRMHRLMAERLDAALGDIRRIQADAREHGIRTRPTWPMIVLRTPKGWTGPKVVDGKKIEGTFRSHQVPLPEPRQHPEHLAVLEQWLRSYRPEELFDDGGRLRPEIAALAPEGTRRMGANPHANGGLLLRDLCLPDFREHAVAVPSPGAVDAEDTRVTGRLLRDVVAMNDRRRDFRVFAPDELESNRLGAILEVTERQWLGERSPDDEHQAVDGRVMEMLSEHQCEGWL